MPAMCHNQALRNLVELHFLSKAAVNALNTCAVKLAFFLVQKK